MRCLTRNKRRFWYCLFLGKEPILDESGLDTGENRNVYAAPVEMFANISPAYGESQTEQFGDLLDYDKVIVSDKLDSPLDENSVLFVDKVPEHDEDGTPLFDYAVKRVARSLNSVSYAIKRNEVT